MVTKATSDVVDLASPTLTGVPTAPTASPGTNSVQIATTAYADAIAALKANLASPALTGTPTVPTASLGTNTTQAASTAFVVANAGGGIVTPDKLSPFVGPYRNALMNGNFEIWQRGTSFATLGASALVYTADRWAYMTNGAARATVTQDASVPTFAQAGVVLPYSLKVACTTTNAAPATGNYSLLAQNIEGYLWRKFWQRPLVISFWVKASQTGTFGVTIESGASDRSYIGQYTVSVANTWEFKTVAFLASPSSGTWPLATTPGAGLYFSLCAGATYISTAGSWLSTNAFSVSGNVNVMSSTSNVWQIAGLQLEVGTAASEFEDVPFDVNLQRCKRYFQKSFDYNVAPAPWPSAGSSGAQSWACGVGASTASVYPVMLPVVMRAAPVLVLWNPSAANAQMRNGTLGTDFTLSAAANSSERNFWITATSPASSVAGNSVSVHWTADAE